MSKPLTREEYDALARELVLPANAFIDGGFRPARSGNTFATVNPASGVKLADIAACDAEDVDFAVKKARGAFDDGRRSRPHPGERKEILIRLCNLMTRNRRELAHEAGVPAGVLNIVTGSGSAVGEPLGRHPDVDSNDAALAREEIFGPILSVISVNSREEVIAVANDTECGLAASIFTSNVKRAIRGARAIRVGTVTVNSFGEGDITTPFGGYKQSGFGGRDNSVHAHDQYTQIKTIWLDLSSTVDRGVA